MSAPYGPVIVEHFRNPRNYGDLDGADILYEAANPVCGDRIRLALRVSEGVVTAAMFRGDACAICTAAASLLTERLPGRTLDAALAFADEEMLAALGAEIRPSRRACALLPLQALREGIRAYRRREG